MHSRALDDSGILSPSNFHEKMAAAMTNDDETIELSGNELMSTGVERLAHGFTVKFGKIMGIPGSTVRLPMSDKDNVISENSSTMSQ